MGKVRTALRSTLTDLEHAKAALPELRSSFASAAASGDVAAIEKTEGALANGLRAIARSEAAREALLDALVAEELDEIRAAMERNTERIARADAAWPAAQARLEEAATALELARKEYDATIRERDFAHSSQASLARALDKHEATAAPFRGAANRHEMFARAEPAAATVAPAAEVAA